MRLAFGIGVLATFVAGGVWAQDLSSDELERVRHVIEGFKKISSWRIDEARQVAEESLERDPDSALTAALVADLKMHQNDYRGAVDFFEVAKNAGAPQEVLRDAPLAEAARIATEGYEEHVGDHFLIRHPPGKDAILVPHALETLDKARERIGDLLGFKPEGRVGVEIYPASATLAAVSTLTRKEIETSGTIALCRWNRLMITSPRGVVFGYSWRDTLAHELAHLIIGGASKNTVPIWLHEGIAKYVETAWRGEPGMGISVEQQKQLRTAAKKNKLIPFSKMHPSMAKLKSQEETSLAFAEVFTFIEFLVDQKGWQGIREVLVKMSEGSSDLEAIEFVFGASMKTLTRKWKKTLKTRPIKRPQNPGLVKGDRKLVMKEQPNLPDDALHGISKKGRRFARAADLLYTRGRFKAAQKELEKAYEETKSPLLSAKLATVALATGDLATAEKAARAAMRGSQDLAGPSVTLAEILVRRNKFKDAELALQQAININPFDPRIHQLGLAIAAAAEDSEALARTRRTVELLSRGRRTRAPSLGKGGQIKVEGKPFHRVFLRKDGSETRIATGQTTPTSAIALAPGRYELELVPPAGPSIKQIVQVHPEGDNATPQLILISSEGS